jgi:alpha-glucosidase
MLARRPNKKPLIITRSTFAGAGKHVGKWLGDNLSTWEQYRLSIAGMLNFASIFNVPMVGSDVCGFGDNTTETLCARWATLGAFNPFFRNHNIDTGISQEFYIWNLTTKAAKSAIDIRYRLLDYLYTGLHEAHVSGTPVLSPLFYSYPKDTATFGIDLQFFYGPSLLVSPVTEENTTSVKFYLPRDSWYEFPGLVTVQSKGEWVTKDNVDYDQIPLHIKGGSILPLRNESAMTTTELRTKPFEIVVAPSSQGTAEGALYLDDGETLNPAQSKTTQVTFEYKNKKLSVKGKFGYDAGFSVRWSKVKVAGVDRAPKNVRVDGRSVQSKYDASTKVLEIEVAIQRLKAFELVLA